ncbi:MAG: 50S ribosomal protein L31 [Anaerolineae bacterium]|nr:50S ribosomal protein L31 [Anaerolineae bacterium]
MKKGIHPNYFPESQVTCACGNSWTTGSTRKAIRTEICYKCHPFYTGEQARIVDTEGQVDRFYRKLQARASFVDQKKARDNARTSLDRPLAELSLGTRPTDALAKAGVTTVGQVIALLEQGETAVLNVEGFGRKSLIDLKKTLRGLGYQLPAAADEVVA